MAGNTDGEPEGIEWKRAIALVDKVVVVLLWVWENVHALIAHILFATAGPTLVAPGSSLTTTPIAGKTRPGSGPAPRSSTAKSLFPSHPSQMLRA